MDLEELKRQWAAGSELQACLDGCATPMACVLHGCKRREKRMPETSEKPPAEFFELPSGLVVCFHPGGRWHGWLFRRHPDGALVSEFKMLKISPTESLHLLIAGG